MASSPGSRSDTFGSIVVQFGTFELNRRVGELRKHGTRIRLQPKPMHLLCALLDRPGEIVTREELKARLWPDDTFVDFESGLNTAVNRLRVALGDSAEHPRYIETEARSGYRFIAPVQAPLDTPAPVATPSIVRAAPEVAAKRRIFRARRIAALITFFVIAAAVVIALRRPDLPVTFRQITFRRGQVSGARFADGSRNIIYAAQWEDEPRRIYEAHLGDPVSRVLGFDGLSLAAVSRLGELAVMRSDGTMNIGGGTLSRVTVNGGPIQQVAENIFGVDWSSDGRRMALVRVVAGAQQVEFPEGRVLYRTAGWLSNLRVAPGDDSVAFIEHPVRHDDAGAIRIVDVHGNVVTLANG